MFIVHVRRLGCFLLVLCLLTLFGCAGEKEEPKEEPRAQELDHDASVVGTPSVTLIDASPVVPSGKLTSLPPVDEGVQQPQRITLDELRDTIYFKNGKQIAGIILSEDQRKLHLQVLKDGRPAFQTRFDREDIDRIERMAPELRAKAESQIQAMVSAAQQEAQQKLRVSAQAQRQIKMTQRAIAAARNAEEIATAKISYLETLQAGTLITLVYGALGEPTRKGNKFTTEDAVSEDWYYEFPQKKVGYALTLTKTFRQPYYGVPANALYDGHREWGVKVNPNAPFVVESVMRYSL